MADTGVQASPKPLRLVASDLGLDEALAGLGLAAPRPVLVLVGGASGLDPRVAAELLGLFESLAPLLDRAGAAVVDGGTAFGVMAAMGLARRNRAARFPLIGVAAAGTVESPGGGTGRTRLDPNHSHFLLVPGSSWGDESPWIARVADRLAGDRPALTLVAGGGEVTRLDCAHNLASGRPLAVLAGSGGTSDLLAAWRREGRPISGLHLGPESARLISVLDLENAGAALPGLLGRLLGV